jgi:hypothetical protein
MAELVCRCVPNYVFERNQNNENIFRHLLDNQACTWDTSAPATGISPINSISSRQIFDALSGVDASDVL